MDSFTRGALAGLLGSVLVLASAAAVLSLWLSRRRKRISRSLQRIRAAASRRAARLSARAQRAEQLAEIGTLTGGLAHEIKNPLSTVQLNLQLLQEDLDPSDPAYTRLASRLGTLGRETARLRDILDDFLRFAGKIELRRERVDLNRLLEELVDFFAPQAQLNRVQIRFKPAAGALLASIDPRLIKQAVLNLMINALQAMNSENGGAGGELILTATAEGSNVVIDVIDTGPGIPAEDLEKIFLAYYSTKRSGTGLGLAMTKRIVEEHGGQIGVRSEVGKGSDFFIRLPMG